MGKRPQKEKHEGAMFAVLYFVFAALSFYRGSIGSFSPGSVLSMPFMLGVPLGFVYIYYACRLVPMGTLFILILVNLLSILLTPVLRPRTSP